MLVKRESLKFGLIFHKEKGFAFAEFFVDVFENLNNTCIFDYRSTFIIIQFGYYPILTGTKR